MYTIYHSDFKDVSYKVHYIIYIFMKLIGALYLKRPKADLQMR